MRLLPAGPVALVASVFFVACASPSRPSPGGADRAVVQDGAPIDPPKAPDGRAAIVQLLEVGIGQARPDVVRRLVGPRYRQHNPRVPDGPEGVIGFVETFSKLPPSKRIQVRVLFTLVDGEFVASLSEYNRRGRIIAGFDVLRYRDGLFREHWDGGMRQDHLSPSGRGLLGAQGARDPAQGTAESKRLVREFVDEVVLSRNDARLPALVADDCIQHHPDIADGASAWTRWFAQNRGVRMTRLVRLIGDGDLVMTQAAAQNQSGHSYVLYDLYRLAGGRIVEHWTAWERVPAEMAHENGML